MYSYFLDIPYRHKPDTNEDQSARATNRHKHGAVCSFDLSIWSKRRHLNVEIREQCSRYTIHW